MKLYIGNQNYSSWSLRAWLIFQQFSINTDIEKLVIFSDEFYRTLSDVSPTKKVPVLVDSDLVIWDSLAILEYINEQYLQGAALPADPKTRAKARSLACEMHSGFMALRQELPMNCRAKRRVRLSDSAKKDISRIDAMWAEQMKYHPDGWLFGDWTIVDAMYAPIALRFDTYGIELSASSRRYQHKVLESAAINSWLQQASFEQDIIDEDEAGDAIIV